MSKQNSIAEFMRLIEQSGLIDPTILADYLHQRRDPIAPPDTSAKVADQLVAAGWLTHFQAEQLLRGKYKEFTIGRYRVLDRLGAGATGTVYLCQHQQMRRRVAVKVLSPRLMANASAIERFYREGRAAAALDHPNIIHAFDVDRHDDLHYLVMEYVEGVTLQQRVEQRGPLRPDLAAHYLRQAAAGLHCAQQAQLIHRDIKPSNLLVDARDTLKILDLGLARFVRDDGAGLSNRPEDRVLGSIDYVAPEQALDSHNVDIRADIYSLGCTFYFCLTGQPPFPHGTLAQKLLAHQMRAPTPISSLRPDVPDLLATLLSRMMAKDPADRCQTPAAVIESLAATGVLPYSAPIASPAVESASRMPPASFSSSAPSGRLRRGRLRTMAATSSAVLLLILLGLLLWSRRQESNESAVGSRPPPTAPATKATASKLVHVVNLPEAKVEVENAAMFKKGRIRVNGVDRESSLLAHPRRDGRSLVVYQLKHRFSTFQTQVGIADNPDGSGGRGLLTFVVRGDGRDLWRSKPMDWPGAKREIQECQVSVQDVEQLELEVLCAGKNHYAWVTWISPSLIPK